MTTVNPAIFKAYDIRSIYPTELNEEVIADVARGVYAYLSKRLNKRDITIVLGRDMRLSSPSLFAVMRQTLIDSGAHVINIGLVATPTVYYTLKKYGYDVGIQISASHNPAEYNGVKMAVREGEKLVKIGKNTGMPDIKDITLRKEFLDFTHDGTEKVIENIVAEEVTEAIETINPGDVSMLNIVSDPANSMGIPPVKELFSRFDAKLTMINDTLDGTFPAHQADPLQHKTLRQLQDKVVEMKADLGICTDGDADRAMFIDEKGDIIPATLITALIAKEVLMDHPGATILVDIRYVRSVENAVKELGGITEYTKIGHAFITQQMNEGNGQFAGESSGHYYFKEMGGCESTIRVILYVLRVLAREQRPISEILKSVHTSIESGEFNYELPHGLDMPGFLMQIEETYSAGTVSKLDGLAIDFPEWRFSIRTSNTEPLLRLNIEGNTAEIVKEKVAELQTMIVKTGAELKE
ncbi:MAG: phosphomannomutase/phosphoglucomutase [Weeksellaceae bacterium]